MRIVEAQDVEGAMEALCDEAHESGLLPLAVFPGETKDDVMREFARRLSFPDYFGRNLDAFADAMSDFVLAMVAPTSLVVGMDPEFAHSRAAEAVEEILAAAESESTDYNPLTVTLVKPAAG